MLKSSFSLKQFFLALLAALILAPAAAPAQTTGPSAAMMNSALLKLFSPHTSFSCKAEIHLLDALQKEIEVVPFDFSVSDGKMRIDIDFARLKGSDIPALPTTLKELGMDQSVIIMRPDQKIVLSIYPHAKAYTEKPMSKDEVAASEKTYTLEKTKLGKETCENHPCEKCTVVLTDDKGVKHTATVWYATDLKEFPVQIKMTEQDSTLLMKFRDIKLSKPDLSRFAAPTGLTKYKTDEALMDAATKGTLPK